MNTRISRSRAAPGVARWIAAAALAAAAAGAWALPSVQDVESAVRQGQYAQAETMMKEVVDAKPNSAKGHYLYAEILAHNRRFAQASTEAAAAARLDPSIGFTQPEKFQSFQDLLAREQQAETRMAPTATRTAPAAVAPAREVAPQRSGVPGWVWLVGLAIVGWALWRGFSRSRAATAAGAAGVAPAGYAGMPPGAPAGYGAGPGGYPPGYGQQPPMGGGMGMGGMGMGGMGRGGGLLGTGLAAAGGVAAGMALDRMLHPGQTGGADHAAGFGGAAAGGDLGQLSNFDNAGGGFANNEPARELEDRSIDFGAGGNDWGGDAGGSFDAGGGGSDGSWD